MGLTLGSRLGLYEILSRIGAGGMQTGWTGLVATVIQLYGLLNAKRILEIGQRGAFAAAGEVPEERRGENVA